MNLTNMEIGLIVVEGSILISFLIAILYMKRALNAVYAKRVRPLSYASKSSPPDLERVNELLKESESITLTLSRNLEEKREIAKRLMETLDEKIKRLEMLLLKPEERDSSPIPNPDGQERNDPILQMAQAGCGVADIARRLGLAKEEVQLIIDLRKIAMN
ncbi:MAG: hypothetical protein FJ117_17670 [Deltaproteobacteria bacterium]|nr:hypothetical protein [Deltaproteobacteria bacterium]